MKYQAPQFEGKIDRKLAECSSKTRHVEGKNVAEHTSGG